MGGAVMKMFAMAGLVFAADLAAVLLIVLSLWIENWLGLSHTVLLDLIFVAAICYGVAGWIIGRLFMRAFPALPAPAEDEQRAPAHFPRPSR
jgi:hypothetical protein